MEDKKVRGNPDKLQPVRTKQEARERGRNGGIASGKARRRKASLMKCARRVLEAPMQGNMRKTVENLVGELEDDEDMLLTATVAVMAKEALGGNVAAFRELKDIMGQMEGTYRGEEHEDDLSRSLRELGESL